MEAKKAKLVAQFNTATVNQVEKLSDVFKGIGIYVNGRTAPTADELKHLMAAHGGEYHTYQSARTTHIVASNLPNVKARKFSPKHTARNDFNPSRLNNWETYR